MHKIWKNVAYAGRYGRIQVLPPDFEWTWTRVRGFNSALSELLKEESDAIKRASDD